MARNVIKPKHGSTPPQVEDLEEYELGYHGGALYVRENDEIVKISGGGGNEDFEPFADWNAKEGEFGHILNRPLADETNLYSFTGKSMSKGEVSQITTETFIYEKMRNLSIELTGVTGYTIVPDVKRKAWLTGGNGSSKTIVFVYGPDLNLSTTSVAIYYLTANDSATQIGLFIDSDCEFEEKWYEKGLYIWGTGSSFYVSKISFEYDKLIFNEIYKDVFKDARASNVYKLDLSSLVGNTLTDQLISQINAEIGKYGPGDVLLLPRGLIELLEGVQ